MLVASVIACAYFMQWFDSTVILTALPQMAKSFGSSPADLSLAVTSYILSTAVFIPVSGWVADRFGTRNVFRAAIVVFTLASIGCGFSNSIVELTIARLVQGIGASMMVPVGRLILLRTFDKSQLVTMTAFVSVPALIGPIMAPPIGGFITTYFSWRWVFFLNIPMGLAGIVAVSLVIKNLKEENPRPFDWLGFLLTGAALCSFMYVLELVGHGAAGGVGWHVVGLLVLVAVVAGTWGFMHQKRHPTPLIDLTLFKIPTFRVANDGGSLFRIGVGASMFLQPVLLQVGFGMSAFSSGLTTFAGALGLLIMQPITRPLLKAFGFRSILVWNGLLSAMAIGIGCFFNTTTPIVAMFLYFLVCGLTRSLQFTGLGTLTVADLDGPNMSTGSSLASVLQQILPGVGVALAAMFLQVLQAMNGPGVEVGARDIQIVLGTAAAIVALSVPLYLRLPRDAGATVSGHKPRKV